MLLPIAEVERDIINPMNKKAITMAQGSKELAKTPIAGPWP